MKLLRLLKRAAIWGRKKPDVTEIVSGLQVMARELERERNHLEKLAADAKRRAVTARRNGQNEACILYAGEVLRTHRDILKIERVRFSLLRIASYIKRARITARVNIGMERVAAIFGILGEEISAKRVIQNLDEVARRLEQFEIENGIFEETLHGATDGRIAPEELADVMAEIDSEVVESGGRRGTTPSTKAPPDRLAEEIQALERRLGL